MNLKVHCHTSNKMSIGIKVHHQTHMVQQWWTCCSTLCWPTSYWHLLVQVGQASGPGSGQGDVWLCQHNRGTYNIKHYNAVRLTYYIVGNVQCHRLYVQSWCCTLLIVYYIIGFGQHIVCSWLHIICNIAYDIVYDISTDLIGGIRNYKLHSISFSHTPASASTTIRLNNWSSPSSPDPPPPLALPLGQPLPCIFLTFVGQQTWAANRLGPAGAQ